ncbi:hypothetical protein SKAU_G00256870 [Synaphobranchus kaupii]|uniref:Uncharacterized protein n=1 Tax=Synaphobranchus kaupii TaxID=118154 RepID=A0A9Q1ISG6_SYNKA|nr:hypothetical protein SKAU_G00256870 [Synaphobranchus kaupii]
MLEGGVAPPPVQGHIPPAPEQDVKEEARGNEGCECNQPPAVGDDKKERRETGGGSNHTASFKADSPEVPGAEKHCSETWGLAAAAVQANGRNESTGEGQEI